MKVKNIFIALFLLLWIGCKNNDSNKDVNNEEIVSSPNHNETSNSIVDLTAKAKELTKSWKEYQNINEYIQQYKVISISNSLLNAKHLSNLAQQLKDSIRIEKLDIPSVKIRLNVLNNETLRLADMATINQITEEEVVRENANILNAYSALNIKINNIVSQENLNNEVKEFIDQVKKSPSLLDTTPKVIDSIKTVSL